MFWHNFIYEIKSSLRVKDLVIWLMIFPIFLGSVFKMGFDGLYEKDTAIDPIPVAIVENGGNKVFDEVIKTVSDADEPLIRPEYLSEDDALKKLRDSKVIGIIYSGEEIKLTVSDDGLKQSVLKTFLEQYKIREKIITDTLANDPTKVQSVVESLSGEVASTAEIPLTNGNTDPYIQYYFNLIAMVALYGSQTGLHISIGNAANLSSLGARRNCSPTPKSISMLATLLGSFIVQSVCMLICVTFVAFVLKVDFGSRLPLVYAASILGGIMGVSIGFCIGSAGSMSVKVKSGILMAVSMVLCFMSGLMAANMKPLLAAKLPWLNNINPAAVVTDAISALNLYSDYSVFTGKMVTMLIITAVFSLGGFILTRRKKYASL